MSLAWILVPLAASLVAQARGCALVLRAGRLESRGEECEARTYARRRGFVAGAAALGSALFAAWLALALTSHADPLTAVPHSACVTACGVGTLGAALSGFAALLAGLSGKPRPTGQAASALLFVASIALTLAPWLC